MLLDCAGGILAEIMGMGKTVMVLSLCLKTIGMFPKTLDNERISIENAVDADPNSNQFPVISRSIPSLKQICMNFIRSKGLFEILELWNHTSTLGYRN